MMGGPGAGKGTQARRLEKELMLPQVATGDLFRHNIKNQTDLGKLAQKYIDAGELVPDEVTVSMVRERLAMPDCARGALLDGFPRTIAQAEALDDLLAMKGERIGVVPFIQVKPAVLLQRAGPAGSNVNFAAHVALQPLGFTVLTRRPAPWVRLQPLQVRPLRPDAGPAVAWEVGATTWGLPVVVWPRTAGELSPGLRRALEQAPIVLDRVNERELAAAGCRRLVERRAGGSGWRFTAAGREWAELLTYDP